MPNYQEEVQFKLVRKCEVEQENYKYRLVAYADATVTYMKNYRKFYQRIQTETVVHQINTLIKVLNVDKLLIGSAIQFDFMVDLECALVWLALHENIEILILGEE